MDYDDAAADRLEAAYLGPDVTAQRAHTMRLLDIQPGEAVIDLGSGPGFLASDIADATGPEGRVLGIDLSDALISRARRRTTQHWLRHEKADVTQIPSEDASFDVVVSTQVAEYVPDIDAFCAEMHRVMKPGARGLVMATDWNAMSWSSSDPERMARVMAAFAPHCADSSLPQSLRGRLRDAGLEVTGIDCFPIVTTDWHEGCYCQTVIPFIQGYIRTVGTLDDATLDAWAEDLADLNARGEHFFATFRFSFLVTRPH
ncbi:methyltransferase domain-containing protein [Pseudaestuariivita atlantica]|nr:methyltransferase domain-containing protein [Pseudaestuariivita atlantica]